MSDFATKRLAADVDVVAPDGSDVRILLGLAGGGAAHFQLAPGKTSRAVTHRTVEEIWFFVGGRGEMWRRQGDRGSRCDEQGWPDHPAGNPLPFRALGAINYPFGVTMPPWPATARQCRWGQVRPTV